jgi:hypothetical protein
MKLVIHRQSRDCTQKSYNKERFIIKLAEMHTQDKYSTGIMQQLPDEFEYSALKFW